jgi:hypothetical protein
MMNNFIKVILLLYLFNIVITEKYAYASKEFFICWIIITVSFLILKSFFKSLIKE